MPSSYHLPHGALLAPGAVHHPVSCFIWRRYSGADLAGLCQTAVKLSVRETIDRLRREMEAEGEEAKGGEGKVGFRL